ncbi:MAG: hypothetical protein GTN97_01655 [Nitrosopumilaceae archaeon]|nr:hypothetical protein [Nitrosopumilaceae archaeon]
MISYENNKTDRQKNKNGFLSKSDHRLIRCDGMNNSEIDLIIEHIKQSENNFQILIHGRNPNCFSIFLRGNLIKLNLEKIKKIKIKNLKVSNLTPRHLKNQAGSMRSLPATILFIAELDQVKTSTLLVHKA